MLKRWEGGLKSSSHLEQFFFSLNRVFMRTLVEEGIIYNDEYITEDERKKYVIIFRRLQKCFWNSGDEVTKTKEKSYLRWK